ncbi:phospholipid-transporting ATPase ABCA3-like [Amblyomma americanum]
MPLKIPTVQLRQLPEVPPASDSEDFRVSAAILTTMVYCLPLLRRISAITNELSTGLKDEQRTNGLSMPAFWLGHFLSALVIQMVETTAIIGIMFSVAHYGGSCFFNRSDITLVTFVMVLFNVCHILQGMLFAAVCQSGKRAMSVAAMLGFLVPLVKSTATQTLGQLVFRDRNEKLLEALSPQLMGSHVLKTLAYYDDNEGGAGWGVLFKRALGLDSVTLFELLAAMCAAAAFDVFLLFYATNVLPWTTETPQHPLFFLTPGYWRPSPAMPVGEGPASEEPHPDRFEEPPAGEPAADVRHLTVVFGSHRALDDVNVKIYASQVTVLLGHNGAGKTTLMRTLTGLQKPTSGFVNIGGDVHGINTTAFCQQSDVHFPDLTVNEHIIYYGHLQGRGGTELTRVMTETLEAVKLTDKAHCFPDQLSGGMKRRLSMCIALVAKAKVLIFDEPTTGMDPETRRSIWDLISSLRSSSTILLSTHDMEEAEVLADRIIIMSTGKVLGAGSTAFLKNACGVGYTINLSTVPEKFVAERTLEVVQKTAPEAIVKDVKLGSLTIALQTIEHSGFADMFRTLEEQGEDLGIESFGVTVATVADVYIKINKLWTVVDSQDTEGSPAESSPPVQTTLCSGVATYPSSTQRVRGLLTKRFLYWSRSPLSILISWLGTVALFVIHWEPIRTRTSEPPLSVSNLELQSSAHFRGAHCFLQATPATDFTRHFEDLAKSEGLSVTPMTNATKELVEFARRDFASYYTHYAYGVSDTGTEVEGWYNQASPVSLNILLNHIDTALLRTGSDMPKARFTTSVSFHSGGKMAQHVKLQGDDASPVELKRREALSKIAINRQWWPGLLPGILCLTLCCIVHYPVTESLSGMRELQLMTGVSGPLYVATHFLFDLLFQYLVPFVACFAIYSFRYADLQASTIVALYVFVLAFAPMGILEAYMLAEVLHSEGAVNLWASVLFFIGGPLADLLYAILMAKMPSLSHLRLVFMLCPPFALKEVVLGAVNLDAAAAACSALQSSLKAIDVSKLTADFCQPWQGASPVLEHCCLSALKNADRKVDIPGLFSLSEHGILMDVAFIVAAGSVLFLLLSLLHSGHALQLRALMTGARGSLDSDDSALDEDVRAEKEHVRWLASNDASAQLESEGCALVASNLHKKFGTLWAVRGINLALRRGECFGLLGVNGAGKSTTFQMLTGLLQPTAGDAYMADVALSASPRKWQSYIGYCPQTNELLGKLTSFEHLRLFSRLRGIPEPKIEEAIQAAIALVDLEKHADKPCGVCSGGNKRKLYIATSILGNPRVVLLDEPYAGVDVVAREKIGGNLSAMRNQANIAVVLTSHGMEECEAMCDRLCIMVAGQMTCLGTLQHLKDKFGRGYTMQLLLPSAKTEGGESGGAGEASPENSGSDLDIKVEELFPGVRVLGAHGSVHDYHISEKLPWSTIFEKVEELEKSFTFAHVLIQDTNLEKIFISFAGKSNAPTSV